MSFGEVAAALFLVLAIISRLIAGPNWGQTFIYLLIWSPVIIPVLLVIAYFSLGYITVDRPEKVGKKRNWKSIKNHLSGLDLTHFIKYRIERCRILDYFDFLQRKYGKEIFPFNSTIISDFEGNVFTGNKPTNRGWPDFHINGEALYREASRRPWDPLDAKEFFGYEFYQSGFVLMSQEDQDGLTEVLRRYMMIALMKNGHIYADIRPRDQVFDMLEMAYTGIPEEKKKQARETRYDAEHPDNEEMLYKQIVHETPVLPPKVMELIVSVKGDGINVQK